MDKKAAKFIIDVYPINPLSLTGQQFYSYLWNTEIPKGSLVSIPFFKRNIEGIAINSRTDFERLGNFKLKKVNKILEENFLTENQLKLAEFISEYYLSPIGTVLKFFCPKRTKERIRNNELRIKDSNKKIKLTKEQQGAVNEITKNHSKFIIHNSKFLLYGPASSGKTEVYVHAIAKLKAKNVKYQFLILLPELTLTPQAVERYGQYFRPEKLAIIHSKVSKGQLYSNWQRIKSGEAKIIIGTRMAVFAPFKNLGLIIVDEEQDISFKQWDMNPRYDARSVAKKLSEINNCPLVFGSASPRVEDYFKTINGEYILLELPQFVGTGSLRRDPVPTKTEIIDMRKERWVKNYSPISKRLQSEIAYTLKYKLQTILFINRQGMSSFSICDNCKTVLKCPRCDRALIYGNSGEYKCLHCNHKTDFLAACSKCKGIVFKNIGLGTQKVEKEVNKFFPGARIQIADTQSMKKTGAQNNLYQDFANGKIDILVGTQMITKNWDFPNVGLVGIIDADNLLSFPDFRNDERAFQNIIQAAGRTNRINSKFPGKVIIQTFNPENKLIKLAAERNFEKFYEQEILEREALDYPPFKRLIKLIYQDADKSKVEKETFTIFEKLKNAARKIKLGRISKPSDPLAPKINGQFRKQIIIKLDTDAEIEPILRKTIISLGRGWIVDVDPVSVI